MEFGWIDFSREQRNKVLNVINLLSEPGAVDELGVGTIRDGFADIFFPGTSTIQTRAKYFLIVPYLLKELERAKGLSPNKMIEKLHNDELDLIDVFKASGGQGIIGELSGRKLRRKPSDIYWNGIRRFGIFTHGRMSLNEYARLINTIKKDKHAVKSSGKRKQSDGDDNDFDDSNAFVGDFVEFWNLPMYYDWREKLTIDLTYPEAAFLKERIIESVQGSLLSFVLEQGRIDFLHYRSFGAVGSMMDQLPEEMKADYVMARDFADFIYGAQIRYNLLLSKGKDDRVNREWELWREGMESYSQFDLYKLFHRLGVKNISQRKFLLDLKEAMKDKDFDKMDSIIINREIHLKGKKRAKLCNLDEYRYENWVGIRKLQYRLPNVQRILRDIFEGLGDIND